MTAADNKPFKIYTASAGSGKTFTIVREYLILCLGDNADAYREILAVTFTNKAANEMKAKILRFLQGIADGSEEKDIRQMKEIILKRTGVDEKVIAGRSKALYTKILHNYSDMSVSTIDSFVQHLSRSFARELDLPGQYSVMLDDDDLVDEIIQMISDEIGENKFITTILSKYVQHNLSDETSWNVKSLIGNFIRKLLKEDAYNMTSKNELVQIDEDRFKELKDYVKSVNDSTVKAIDNLVESVIRKERELGINPETDYAQKTRGLRSILSKMSDKAQSVITKTTSKMLDGKSEWKSKSSTVCGDEMLYCFRDAVDKYNKLFQKHYIFSIIQKDLYLYVLRNHIFELINDYIADSFQVHISEFNKRISDVLGDCSVPFIYERIGERYKHYFIDEFQDTSVLQWQNFLPLVDNSLAQGNMNLIVGDAKQSIYRFRSGEVEQIINLPKIYNRKDNEFSASCEQQFEESADKLSLVTNYRSSKNIIKFNNTFFRFTARRLANTENDANLEHVFDDTEQIYQKEEGGLVSVMLFSGELETKDYVEKVMASMLAKIKELKSKGIEYKDITIQVRSNGEGTRIANYLTENGIEVVSAESVQLQTSDKVQLIIATLRYFVDNDNPVTLKTISYYFEKTHQGDSIDEFDFKKLQSIYNQAYSLYDMCVQICKLYQFNMLEDVFVQYFMNMLYDWQSGHTSGIDAFVEYWDKKKGNLNVQITGELNCVNIMTIHKSKGLEFRVVMYPFADVKLEPSLGFTNKEMWIKCRDNEMTKDIPYLDAFLLPISKENMKDTDFEYIMKHEEQKTQLDTLNVMYVSMTRAKEMLYIYSTDKVSKTDTGYNIYNDFFDENAEYIIHHNRTDDDTDFDDFFLKRDEIKADDIKEDGVVVGKVYTYGIEKDSYSDTISDDVNSGNYLEIAEAEKAPKSLQWFEKLKVEADPTMVWSAKETFKPDEWGSLVHEIFSKIKTENDIERVMRSYINDGTIDFKLAEKLKQRFLKVIDIECIKAAYSSDALILNEMDIHTSSGHIMRPDRYAVTKDGTILIDYKTGKRDEKYHQQLQDYMLALRKMNGNQEIKAYLVYLGDEIDVEEVRLDRLF